MASILPANVRPRLHVLTGCTAVGKTEAALRWAERNSAEIVSCDSLLFYRGMDIGTAKPAAAERARVPHHLIDILDVTDRMDVTRYVGLAREAAAAIARRGNAVLITGGSGFYLKAFFAPVADAVDVPAEIRESVRARLESEGLESLVAELGRLNPGGVGGLDVRNPRRVTRALERCLASGRMLAELRREFESSASAFAGWDVSLSELVREESDLDARIRARVDAMLGSGLVEEVRGLVAAGIEANPSASRAIGYRETIEFLKGALPAEKLAATIAQNTRALVKKQRTWFRTQLPPHRQLPAGRALDDVSLLFNES